MAEELRVVESSPRTESEQANQGVKPKREGDLRKAEQRVGPRRIGDRGKNWRGQIEYKQWKDRERRRLEGERRRASHERRQSERRGKLGDRRKEAPERRALFNPPHRRFSDFDYRTNKNDDLPVRPEGHSRVGTPMRCEDSVSKQGPPGSTYSPQVALNIPGTPSEAAPSSNVFRRLLEVGRQVRERWLRSFH